MTDNSKDNFQKISNSSIPSSPPKPDSQLSSQITKGLNSGCPPVDKNLSSNKTFNDDVKQK